MPEPLDPNRYFVVANRVAQSANEEDYRTAINRVYYGAFLIARSKLGMESHESGAHTAVINALRLHDEATGNQLKAIFELRKVADYELAAKDVNHQDWAKNWLRAQQILFWILPKLDAVTNT